MPMKSVRNLFLAFLLCSLIALASVPVAFATDSVPTGIDSHVPAQESEDDEHGGPSGGNVNWEVVLWSLAGIGAGAVVFGIFYLFKRQVGAFPEHPTWVAPISVMRASENATEETFGLQADHGHADSHH